MVRRVLCPAFKRFFELHERLPLGRRSFSSSWDRWSAVRGCDPHARICFPTKPPASDRLDIFSPTHPCSSPRSSHPSCGARAGPSPPVDDGPSPPPPSPRVDPVPAASAAWRRTPSRPSSSSRPRSPLGSVHAARRYVPRSESIPF